MEEKTQEMASHLFVQGVRGMFFLPSFPTSTMAPYFGSSRTGLQLRLEATRTETKGE